MSLDIQLGIAMAFSIAAFLWCFVISWSMTRSTKELNKYIDTVSKLHRHFWAIIQSHDARLEKLEKK